MADATWSERIPEVLEIVHPDVQAMPVVLASPHSGCNYPAEFLAASRLGPVAIRRSEDAFVDRIAAIGPPRGAPLIKALFPRAYLDVNREAYELDPEMFDGPLPPFVNTISPRAAIGLGTIPRVVGHDQPIYPGRISFSDVQHRIDELYYPYHAALEALVRETRLRFGICILLDCHSMPTQGSALVNVRPDIVLGDGFGATCAPAVAETAAKVFSAAGLKVERNRPYAGGYTTRHYGRPAIGVHTLQIEMARALYMDEQQLAPLPTLTRLSGVLGQVVDAVARLDLPLSYRSQHLRAAD